MAQFGRPSSDITNAWASGGWADLDETSFSDSDFAYSADKPASDVLEVAFSSVTDPTSSSGHTVRYRWATVDGGTLDGGGTAVTQVYALIQGTTVIATLGTHTTNSATFSANNVTLSAGEADSITDYSDLRLRITASGGSGSPANRRGAACSWAEIEVPDAASTDRAAHVTAFELEAENAARAAHVTAMELEAENAKTLSVPYFYWRKDDGVEGSGGASFIGSENDAATIGPDGSGADLDTNIRLRILVDEGNTGNPPSSTFQLIAQKNGGASFDVTGASSNARMSASIHFASGDPTTDHGMTQPAGTFFAGEMDETDGLTGALQPAQNQYTILEYCIQIRSAEMAQTDYLRFGVEFDGVEYWLPTGLGWGGGDAYHAVVGRHRVHARFRNDDGNESSAGATFLKAQDVSVTIGSGQDIEHGADFRLRVLHEDVNGLAAMTYNAFLWHRKQGTGPWIDVGETVDTDVPLRMGNSGNLTHDAVTTDHGMTVTASGSFGAGRQMSTDQFRGTSATIGVNGYTIDEWSLESLSANWEVGDVIEFAITTGDTNDFSGAYILPVTITAVDTSRAAHVTAFELEAENAPRAAHVTAFELEATDGARAAFVTAMELEAENAPRAAHVTAFELEAENAPRAAHVTAFELETENLPVRAAHITAFELEAENAARAAHVTAMELEVENAPRAAHVTAFELEATDGARAAHVTAMELEATDGARAAFVTAMELEATDGARAAFVTAMELEAENAPRAAHVTAMELEATDGARAAHVTAMELETEDAVAERAALITAFELEAENAPRAAHVTAMELEAENAARAAHVTAMELEVENAPRAAHVTAFELEVETAPRAAFVTAFEMGATDIPRAAHVTAMELEVATAPRSGYVTAFEMEAGSALRAAHITAFEMQAPEFGAPSALPDRRWRISLTSIKLGL